MLDLAACTDGELAALALGGREAAYRALMDRHRAAAFRLARHHCGNDDAALDVTQQSFIAALRVPPVAKTSSTKTTFPGLSFMINSKVSVPYSRA